MRLPFVLVLPVLRFNGSRKCIWCTQSKWDIRAALCFEHLTDDICCVVVKKMGAVELLLLFF